MKKQSTTTAPKYEQHYYATLSKTSDGHDTPWHIHPTEADAIEFALGQRKHRRYAYEPMADEKRFRVMPCRWDSDYRFTRQPLPKSEKARQRFYEEWHAAEQAAPLPVSLVSLPPSCKWNTEWSHEDSDIVSRIDGMKRLSEHTAEELKTKQWREVWAREWWVLVELGTPLPNPLTTLELGENGIGQECRNVSFPLRVVQPTAAELAAFPLPAKLPKIFQRKAVTQ